MNITHLAAELMRDEGVVLEPYRDTTGHLTIGVGRNLDANPLTPAEIEVIGHDARSAPITRQQAAYLLGADIKRVMSGLDKTLPWWDDLDEVRRRVLVNMAFNLGVAGLLKFNRTLNMVQIRHYATAAMCMLQSTWSAQVGLRATRLAEMMRTGATTEF